VVARCPRLGYICRVREFAAEPTLELLISNPPNSRAPVVPALTERVSRPLVSNCTLEGLVSRALVSGGVAVTLSR
jgi:hypothetical protein